MSTPKKNGGAKPKVKPAAGKPDWTKKTPQAASHPINQPKKEQK
ncbi:MAG: hypothetical protein ACREFF_07775 [Candidatus Udaeobacter sp.]